MPPVRAQDDQEGALYHQGLYLVVNTVDVLLQPPFLAFLAHNPSDQAVWVVNPHRRVNRARANIAPIAAIDLHAQLVVILSANLPAHVACAFRRCLYSHSFLLF